MTDTTNTAEAARRKKGKGKGVAPAVVLNGSNVEEYFPPPPKKIGAPSTYTPEMADRICKWVAEGKTLYSFCMLEGTPNYFTVADWRRAHPDFDQKYARAKDDGWDVFAEKLVERSVDVPPELAQSRRLEVDTGKWLLSKLAARRYGDRLEVKSEISGPNGGPLQVEMLLNVLLTPANLERLSDIEVESIRSAAGKLALPGPGQVIDAAAEAAASVASGYAGDAAGAFPDGEAADEAIED